MLKRRLGGWGFLGLLVCLGLESQGLGKFGPLTSARAADVPRVQRDVAYAEGPASSDRTRLDVFAPASGADMPVVIWIHGGGWQRGDKGRVETKVSALNRRGEILVSVNYRLHPTADYSEQAADIAGAIRWVHGHIAEFGGSPDKIVLMGHSAGAHMAALVATDERYLVAAGLSLSTVRGVVLLDGAGYDIPAQILAAPLPRLKQLYRDVFGDDPVRQRDASPIEHVAADKGIGQFLILHVARRRDSQMQANALGEKLRAAGVMAQVVAAENKTHATINRELGKAGDEPTRLVLEFLDKLDKTPLVEQP